MYYLYLKMLFLSSQVFPLTGAVGAQTTPPMVVSRATPLPRPGVTTVTAGHMNTPPTGRGTATEVTGVMTPTEVTVCTTAHTCPEQLICRRPTNPKQVCLH